MSLEYVSASEPLHISVTPSPPNTQPSTVPTGTLNIRNFTSNQNQKQKAELEKVWGPVDLNWDPVEDGQFVEACRPTPPNPNPAP